MRLAALSATVVLVALVGVGCGADGDDDSLGSVEVLQTNPDAPRFTDGSIGYVEIRSAQRRLLDEIETGAVIPQVEDEPITTRSLKPGLYRLNSFERPCSGPCPPPADGPTARCTASFAMEQGGEVRATIVREGSACRIDFDPPGVERSEEQIVAVYLEDLEAPKRLPPDADPADYRADTTSLRREASVSSRWGEHSVWVADRAADDKRIVVYSSPSLGLVDTIVDPDPGGIASLEVTPIARVRKGVRELLGRASGDVSSVRVTRENATTFPALLDGGWFVVADDRGHAPVRSLIAIDSDGVETLRAAGRFFRP